MAIIPLFNRVVIKPEPKKDKKTATGFIVSSAYEKTEELHGIVQAIGSEVQVVKVGDIVSFPAYGYETVSDGSEDLMSVREPEIVAVITPY